MSGLASLSESSFRAVREAFHQASGILLSDAKRPLVISRLQKLASRRSMRSLDDYVAYVLKGDDVEEHRRLVDQLTTNETYFFREVGHFQFLAEWLAGRSRTSGLRIWSAASSSGEEAYSIAMLLADKLGLGADWQVVGTDLSSAMVDAARTALYPLDRARDTPADYLKRYCRKGTGAYDGQLLIGPELRAHVSFGLANLMQPLPPDLGLFDIVFLRNVLIYFEADAKAQIVRRVADTLQPGGYLLTGHAESLGSLNTGLQPVRTAVYARH